jgi:hypothetical protein
MKELGVSSNDMLEWALQLYKVKHLKQQPFVFQHCWFILKDVPRWSKLIEEYWSFQQATHPQPQPMPKHKTPSAMDNLGNNVDSDAKEREFGTAVDATSKQPTMPMGTKIA